MTCLKDYLHYRDEQVTLLLGDALAVAAEMADDSVDCIVTSPPYFGLRDYGTDGQYGLESSPVEYVETMRALFSELRRVLADDGTLWLNLGDSYVGNALGRNDAGRDFTGGGGNKLGSGNPGKQGTFSGRASMPPKNLMGMPWRVAFALQDDGWILRNAIIWNKPNAMPESVRDRLSGTYEHVFLFAKSPRYWFDLDPIREEYSPAGLARRKYAFQDGSATYDAQLRKGSALRDGGVIEANAKGRNPGTVWTIPTQPFPGAHFAVFPVQLPQRCILAGCKPGGTVLDPFSGSGTTGLAAQRLGRKYVGIDVNAEYLDLSLRTRLHDAALDFNEVAP